MQYLTLFNRETFLDINPVIVMQIKMEELFNMTLLQMATIIHKYIQLKEGEESHACQLLFDPR